MSVASRMVAFVQKSNKQWFESSASEACTIIGACVGTTTGAVAFTEDNKNFSRPATSLLHMSCKTLWGLCVGVAIGGLAPVTVPAMFTAGAIAYAQK